MAMTGNVQNLTRVLDAIKVGKEKNTIQLLLYSPLSQQDLTKIFFAVITGPAKYDKETIDRLCRNLLTAGANIQARDDAGKTFLYYTERHGFTELSYELVCQGASVSVIEEKDSVAVQRHRANFGSQFNLGVENLKKVPQTKSVENGVDTGDWERARRKLQGVCRGKRDTYRLAVLYEQYIPQDLVIATKYYFESYYDREVFEDKAEVDQFDALAGLERVCGKLMKDSDIVGAQAGAIGINKNTGDAKVVDQPAPKKESDAKVENQTQAQKIATYNKLLLDLAKIYACGIKTAIDISKAKSYLAQIVAQNKLAEDRNAEFVFLKLLTEHATISSSLLQQSCDKWLSNICTYFAGYIGHCLKRSTDIALQEKLFSVLQILQKQGNDSAAYEIQELFLNGAGEFFPTSELPVQDRFLLGEPSAARELGINFAVTPLPENSGAEPNPTAIGNRLQAILLLGAQYIFTLFMSSTPKECERIFCGINEALSIGEFTSNNTEIVLLQFIGCLMMFEFTSEKQALGYKFNKEKQESYLGQVEKIMRQYPDYRELGDLVAGVKQLQGGSGSSDAKQDAQHKALQYFEKVATNDKFNINIRIYAYLRSYRIYFRPPQIQFAQAIARLQSACELLKGIPHDLVLRRHIIDLLVEFKRYIPKNDTNLAKAVLTLQGQLYRELAVVATTGRVRDNFLQAALDCGATLQDEKASVPVTSVLPTTSSTALVKVTVGIEGARNDAKRDASSSVVMMLPALMNQATVVTASTNAPSVASSPLVTSMTAHQLQAATPAASQNMPQPRPSGTNGENGVVLSQQQGPPEYRS